MIKRQTEVVVCSNTPSCTCSEFLLPLPDILACNVPPYGVRAAISHKLIAFASRTESKTTSMRHYRRLTSRLLLLAHSNKAYGAWYESSVTSVPPVSPLQTAIDMMFHRQQVSHNGMHKRTQTINDVDRSQHQLQ